MSETPIQVTKGLSTDSLMVKVALLIGVSEYQPGLQALPSVIAQYLGCTKEVPLSQRMAEVEKRLAALEAEKRGN